MPDGSYQGGEDMIAGAEAEMARTMDEESKKDHEALRKKGYSSSDVLRMFRYQAPDERQVAIHDELSMLCEGTALRVLEIVPNGARRTRAINALHEFKMLASAAVALD